MGKNTQSVWVVVTETEAELVDRLGVEGGWIYRSTQWLVGEDEHGHEYKTDRTESMVFVPDPAVTANPRYRD